MKKFFISMCVALFGFTGFAQEQGDMAVGVNLGVAPCVESGASVTNFGLGAKFQYNVTDPIRLEADLEYWFKDNYMSVFDITANAHYLIKASDKFTFYPLVGIGYGSITASDSGDYDGYNVEVSISESRFLVNVGVGAEYALTEKLSLGLEFKYQYMKDFGRLPIQLGLTYKF